ncbi:MAG: RraA family protein [Alphaproteobacteria bacterium]
MASAPPHDPALLATLAQWDTPTICNAIEEATGRPVDDGITRRTLHVADLSLPPMVGYARTATIRAAQASDADRAELTARRLAWYGHVAAAPGPAIVVLEDLDDEPGIGAFWGEVHTRVHLRLGALGAITNGSMRDLHMLAPGFQILAGEIGPSHAWIRVEEIGLPVTVCGLSVTDDDLIHADRHGAVVIPHHVAAAIPAAVGRIMAKEKVILDLCAGDFSLDALRRTVGGAIE